MDEFSEAFVAGQKIISINEENKTAIIELDYEPPPFNRAEVFFSELSQEELDRFRKFNQN